MYVCTGAYMCCVLAALVVNFWVILMPPTPEDQKSTLKVCM